MLYSLSCFLILPFTHGLEFLLPVKLQSGYMSQEMSPLRALIDKVVGNEWVKFNFWLNYPFMVVNLSAIMDRCRLLGTAEGGPFVALRRCPTAVSLRECPAMSELRDMKELLWQKLKNTLEE